MAREKSISIPLKHLKLFGKESRIIHLEPFPWGIWLDLAVVNFDKIRELSDDYAVVLVPKKQLR